MLILCCTINSPVYIWPTSSELGLAPSWSPDNCLFTMSGLGAGQALCQLDHPDILGRNKTTRTISTAQVGIAV